MIVKGKTISKPLQYINDLKGFMANPDQKCQATTVEWFQDTTNLVNLLKTSALQGIAHCLSQYAAPKYNHYTEWEKFYQTFQWDLFKMA